MFLNLCLAFLMFGVALDMKLADFKSIAAAPRAVVIALLAQFVAHLRDDAPLPCPGSDHVRSLHMVEACIRSSATGQTVDPRHLRVERTSS